MTPRVLMYIVLVVPITFSAHHEEARYPLESASSNITAPMIILSVMIASGLVESKSGIDCYWKNSFLLGQNLLSILSFSRLASSYSYCLFRRFQSSRALILTEVSATKHSYSEFVSRW